MHLRISPRKLDQLVRDGQIHPLRVGRRKRLYTPGALDGYLRLNSSGTTSRRR